MFKLFKERVAEFRADTSGASMVEYGVALLVVIAIGVTAMSVLGGGVYANVQSACVMFGLTC